MAEYTKLVSGAGERVISRIKQAEDVAVAAVSQVSGSVGKVIPELPSTIVTAKVPNPRVFVEAYFGLLEDLVKTQKSYALNLLKAVEPITGKILPAVKTRRTKKAATQDN